MKSYNESEFYDNQMNSLEDELQELLERTEKILDYKSEDINQVVEDLLSLNTEESTALATDIIEIEEDILLVNEEFYYENDQTDDPFVNLYDEDSEE